MKIETELDFQLLVNGSKALAVVSAWNALGLFEQLRKGPIPRTDLKADARALTITIPVLAHLGLVVADAERIGLTAPAERLLSSGAMPTARNLDMFGELSRTLAVIRDGGPVRDAEGRPQATRGGTRPGDVAATESFLDMLYRMSEEPSRSTFAWLSPELPPKAEVLDLGGGHGRYARAFADAGHRATVFDQPMVITLAKKRHGNALAYLEGDFHTAESFGGPYDLILLCNIVHGESAEANASMLRRLAKNLRPGGRIAIRDMILDEHGRDPASAVFFGLMMLFYTEHGTSPTVTQARGWLEGAGLGDLRLATFETHQIMTARRLPV